MTMRKIVSAAAALLTAVSGACICPLTASAANADNYVLTAADIAQLASEGVTEDDIAILHAMGTTDADIAHYLQRPRTRSSTQLNHFVCFAFNYDSSLVNQSVSPNIGYPGQVSYYDYKVGFAGKKGTSPTVRTPLGINNWYYDVFHITVKNTGPVAAFQYTSPNNYIWTTAYMTHDWVEQPVFMGDLNGDEVVGIGDVVILGYWLTYNSAPSTVCADWFEAGDLDCDFAPDNDDYNVLFAYVCEDIDCFWT